METPQRSEVPFGSLDSGVETLQLYQAMFQSTSRGLVLHDAEGRVLGANPAAERIIGLALGRMLGRTVPLSRGRPIREDGSGYPEREHPVLEALRSGRPVENTVMGLVDPDANRITWIEVDAVPVFHPGEPRPFLVFSTFADITARREAHQLYEQIIKNAQEGVIVYARDLSYLLWNPYMERLTGVPAAAVLGRQPLDAFPFLKQTAVIEGLKRVMEGGPAAAADFPFSVPETGRSGWVSVTDSPLINARGEIIGAIGMVRDISTQKRAEDAVRESAERLELAVSSGSLGVWELNLADGTQIWNDRMFEIYGLERRGPHPDHAYWCAHIVHPEDLAAANAGIQEALAGNRPYDFEFRVVRPDGEVRHIKSDGLVLRDGAGRPAKVIGMNRDRTREVEAEAERRRLLLDLQHADKMESLGSLAGGVAHDINNVLAAIMGMASLLSETAPDSETRAKALETITLACTRGRDVVKSLLNFSRKDLESVAQVDLNIIAKEMVLLLAHTTLMRVHLTTDFEEPLGLIQGDGGALSHALINLCVNAVDAMPDGGRLALRTRNLDPHWIQVEVEDTGTGMTREVQERALNPFFTTKPQGKGTGLGLSMVYSTVKAHRGQMEIQSRPGQGTCVRMRFPVGLPELQAAEAEPDVRGGADLGRLQVLLVDDDELFRKATLALLDALGCASTAFFSGEEALSHLAGGAQPDVVILDLNMPGLGGAGTLPRLRALRPGLPVLLATGRVDQAAQELAEQDPKVTLLPKPFGLGNLKRLLGAIRASSRS